MQDYTLIVKFHAENDEDAAQQAHSVAHGDGVGFDDGFQVAELHVGLVATGGGRMVESWQEGESRD